MKNTYWFQEVSLADVNKVCEKFKFGEMIYKYVIEKQSSRWICSIMSIL